jgi:hypothetical protein
MFTISGIEFDFRDPKPEMISLDDIIHHCSMACRFVGAIREFYSVAAHMVNCDDLYREFFAEVDRLEKPSLHVPLCFLPVLDNAEWRLLVQQALLIHDGHEAYSGDQASKFKACIPEIGVWQKRADSVIFPVLGLPWPLPGPVQACVKYFDLVAMAGEAAALMHSSRVPEMVVKAPIQRGTRWEMLIRPPSLLFAARQQVVAEYRYRLFQTMPLVGRL